MAGNLVLLLIVVTFLVCLILFFKPIVNAWLNGVSVSVFYVLGMKFRNVSHEVILHSAIFAKKNGLELKIEEMEEHHLSGGRLERVIAGLVLAKKTDLNVSFKKMSAIDLSGGDPYEIVLRYRKGERLEEDWEKILGISK